MITVKRQSILTGEWHEMELPITEAELVEYEEGGDLVQNKFPHLTPDQREFIISGSTPDEWDAAFSEDEGE